MNSKSSDTSEPDWGILTTQNKEIDEAQLIVLKMVFICGLEVWYLNVGTRTRRAEHFGACRPRALRMWVRV